MMAMRKIQILCVGLAALWLASCTDDKGNDSLSTINELEISGIEDEYYNVGYKETLVIPVTLKGLLSGSDENQFDYQWYLCNKEVTENAHKHTVISTEKDLEYPLDIPSGNYRLYFRATDKETGMQWEKVTSLTVLSPFVRGFYLWGDKEDGTCGMDFVSMIEGRDTTMMADLFDNTVGLKKAGNIVFTGTYVATPHVVNLWATAENGAYSLEHSSSLEKFGVLEDVSLDKMVFPTLEVTRPLNFVDIVPHPYGSNNMNRARSWRVLLTERDAFFCGSLLSSEAYGNPMNRYDANTSVLYKPSPYVFYQDNSTYLQAVAFFDETNHCFTVQNGASYAVTHTVKCTDSESPFWFDQNKYTPVRDLVYGENGFNGGYSYALMNDANGDYYIYKFKVTRYGAAGVTKSLARTVDKAVATDFDKAGHYTFFSVQPVILYAVGADLWAYDYVRNIAKKVATMDGEITYLAMDAHSSNTPTDFIVATYSESQKGTVYKYTIKDDPNDIVVEPHTYHTESYPWKTNLKVAKVEYRNSSL